MWFTETAWPPMLIAGLGALVCFGLWNTDRQKLYLVLGIVCLLAIGTIYAVERSIVTEGERVQAIVAQMCVEFQKRQPATFDHFSASVPEWKDVCKVAMDTVEVENDLRLTDFQTTFTNNNSRANVHFRANATISVQGFKGHHTARLILTFQREDGTWKIVDVQRLDPFKGDKMEIMARQ